MINIKEDAEVLRQALVLGMVDSRRAIAWADRFIISGELTEVPPLLYDVSLRGSRSVSDMIELLGELRGSAERTMVSRRLLGVADEWYRAHPEGGAVVARRVRTLAFEGLLPEEEFGHEPLFLTEYFDEPHLFEPGAGDSELRAFLLHHARASGI